jgi:xylan 1,4-beta-xylosidase
MLTRRRFVVAAFIESFPSDGGTCSVTAVFFRLYPMKHGRHTVRLKRKYEVRVMSQSIIHNPVIRGFHPDPSVCRAGKDYYLVTSSFEYFPGVPVFHSRDLVNWRKIGHCLTRVNQLPLAGARSSKGIYAPTIRYHEGWFYMVTTNTSGGGNFFVKTTNPAGEWSDPVWLDQPGIDPSLLFDDDGKVYLTSSGNQQCELDIGTGKRLTDLRQTWKGTGSGWLEGPHLYKINGRYYLIDAEGGTNRGHMATIARSDSPWGPFEACPRNPVLSNRGAGLNPVQSTGHGDLVEAHDGSWWMVFLAIREIPGGFPRVHNLGRETFIVPVMWDADGWPVVNGTGTVNLETPAACLPPHPWPAVPERDDFDAPRLGLEWNFVRNPESACWSLAERPGWLRLKGLAGDLSSTAPAALVMRRQTEFACRFEALLDFEPQREGEEAGITVRMNDEHHYDLAIRREEGSRRVVFSKRIGDVVAAAARTALPPGPVRLIVSANQQDYTFAWAGATGPEQPTGSGRVRYLSTEVAGGFTGMYVGLFAAGNGAASQTTADFDYAEYRVLG